MGVGNDRDQKPMFVPVSKSNNMNHMPMVTLDRLGIKKEYLDGMTYRPDNYYTEMMPNVFHHYTPISNIKGIVKEGGAFRDGYSASTFNIKDDVMQHMDQSELLDKPFEVSGSNYNRHKKNASQSVPSNSEYARQNFEGGKAYYGGLFPLSPEEKAQAQIKDIDAIHRTEGNRGRNGYGTDGRARMSHKPIMRVNMAMPYEYDEDGEKRNGTIGLREGDDMDEVVVNARNADQSISIPKGALNSQYMSKNQKKKFRRYLKNHRSMVEPDKYTLEQLLGNKSPHLKNIEESYGY